MIKVVFFASIRETLGPAELDLVLEASMSIADLINRLVSLHDESWREVLTQENVLIAINQTMVDADVMIEPGDEVAFFPPVTGG